MVVPKYRRREVAGKLKALAGQLEVALLVDAKRPNKDRRTARALFAQIKAAGYAGGYTVVSNFTRAWRQGVGSRMVGGGAFVPLKFELGEAFQFDWSEEGWWWAAFTCPQTHVH